MKYINYESDFKIIESLKNNVPISSAPFKFIYYTRFFRNTLEASYDGKEYINCKPTEDGKLVVVFDNHHLGAGPLKVKRYFYLNDSDFKDGVCDLVSEESLDIYLDKDSATEGCEVDSKVSAYYHVIENNVTPEDPIEPASPTELVVKVTYEELKNLRDNAQLVPGCFYRITNYECIISNLIQEGPAQTVKHKFDIIVQATELNRVSHNAFAAHNDNDSYFSKKKLEAWRLLYDLDNDTTKYFWANKTEGKGVIYRMIDEYNNDLPYDFKNIVFIRDGSYMYTFNYYEDYNGNNYDATVYGSKIYNNKFESGAWNNIFLVVLFESINNNKFGPDCKDNTFKGDIKYNTINTGFTNNNILNDFAGNVIGSYVENNSFRFFNYNTLEEGISGRKFNDISNTNINNRNSITKGTDYYDDGNNKLVPIKHPDLSTQPNILPYKFACNYVYEQLLAIPDNITIDNTTGYIKFDINAPKWEIENPSILKAVIISSNDGTNAQLNLPCVVVNRGTTLSIAVSDTLFSLVELKNLWMLIEYTSFEGLRGYYYYNAANKDDDYIWDGSNYVDLGLPSGTLWSTRNIGATSPEDYGDYFAWGETTTKSDYSSSTSITYGLSISELESRGIIDAAGNLTAAYDAATANWGASWRMPTSDEMEELVNECEWKWTSVNGISGQKVTGPNGNSIFLPAAGSRNRTEVDGRGSDGYYWSGTLSKDFGYDACLLKFNSGHYNYSTSGGRLFGHQVRPIFK